MTRVILKTCTLDSLVKLTPSGKVYRVVLSQKEVGRAALEDENGKIKETPPFTSVYLIKKG